MVDYHFTKNSPTSFPTGRIIAKVDLGLAAYGITAVGGLIGLKLFSPEILSDYIQTNPEQYDIKNFLHLPDEDQWLSVGLFLLWYVFELIIALILFIATTQKNVFLLKTWIILTIFISFLGLVTGIPLYMFFSNKPLFLVCGMIVYMYKLYEIYIMDLFVKEVIGRKAAAAYAAAAAI